MTRKPNLEALNTVCPYYTMFPLDYPLRVLAKAKPGDWVLDPFCGRGTTTYAARLLGLNTYGTDTNPVAVAIAAAKLVTATSEEVCDAARELIRTSNPKNVPSGEFWETCYHPETLAQICALREGLVTLSDSEEHAIIALRAIMLGILHGPKGKKTTSYLSNQMPRTFASKPDYSVKYWRRENLLPDQIDTHSVIKRKAERVLSEIPPRVEGRIELADARSLPDRGYRFAHIVTSPPYYGMETYRVDQWLRLWFLGEDEHIVYGDKSQVSRGGVAGFTKNLAEVWASAAKLAMPDAKLRVRFGALPSVNSDPLQIFRESLKLSNQPWTLATLHYVHEMGKKTRQAVQMGTSASKNSAIVEFDAVAILGR